MDNKKELEMMVVAPSCCAYFGGLRDLIVIESSLLVTDKAGQNVVRIGSKASILGEPATANIVKSAQDLHSFSKWFFSN